MRKTLTKVLAKIWNVSVVTSRKTVATMSFSTLFSFNNQRVDTKRIRKKNRSRNWIKTASKFHDRSHVQNEDKTLVTKKWQNPQCYKMKVNPLGKKLWNGVKKTRNGEGTRKLSININFFIGVNNTLIYCAVTSVLMI